MEPRLRMRDRHRDRGQASPAPEVEDLSFRQEHPPREERLLDVRVEVPPYDGGG